MESRKRDCRLNVCIHRAHLAPGEGPGTKDDLCHRIQLANNRYSHISQFAANASAEGTRSSVPFDLGLRHRKMGEGVLPSHQSVGLDDMRVIGMQSYFLSFLRAAPWFLFLFPWTVNS